MDIVDRLIWVAKGFRAQRESALDVLREALTALAGYDEAGR